MPVDTRWYDDTKKILVVRFSGNWTWEEGRINDEYLRALLGSVDHSVDIIMDVRESQTFPPMLRENTEQILDEPYENFGLSVVTGDRSYFDQIVATSQQIGGFHFDIDHANTIEEALAMIERRHVT
jgi:hypothetical protein